MKLLSKSVTLLAILLLGVTGCNRDWDGRRGVADAQNAPAGPHQHDATTGSMPLPSAPPITVPDTTARAAGLAGPPGFATLPDRGDLVAYPQEPVVRREGAYTWHRADVSEAHALRAIFEGVLNITTPSGERLKFQYERHVEHPSGDWTWVGRLLDGGVGREAILTFGAEAVFGSIDQPGKAPLRLTMRDGAAWLVETDQALLGRIENSATRPKKPDFLVPPALQFAGSGAASDGSLSAPAASVGTASATTAATTVVDVVIGYTTGYASAQGGASAAVTRLNLLVEVTNEAYINSQVDARVRLVHAMQVNYTDTTSNGSALEALTGSDGQNHDVPVPAALQPLRNARDTYGADLVSLVRAFHEPEHGGCGIAWLIGGGLVPIQAGHEQFGYSVVGDGMDQGTDNEIYFCRDETLAHELGHNMGSAHDRVTAQGDDGVLDNPGDYGRYTYSFGHKTGPGAGDFYTIMAYGDQRDSAPFQVAYRVFSNPRITLCGEVPCGVENQADNARSLGQTVSIIAGFRAQAISEPVSNVRNDVNADGRSDLMWSRQSAGRFSNWLMNGSTITQIQSWTIGSQYEAAATGDLDGNGHVDVLWRNSSTGATYVWLRTPTGGYIARFIYKLTGGWELAGTGDVNGDGSADLLWSKPDTGQFVYWLMSGADIIGSRVFTIGSQYRIAGTGDLDGNGRVDVVWRNDSTGATYVWLGTATGGYIARFIYKLTGGWQLAGTGDVNGDGKSDLLWSKPSAGLFVQWLMDGERMLGSKAFAAATNDTVIGTGDLDGNGHVDVVWRDSPGNVHVWLGSGTGYVNQFIYRLGGWTLLP